MQTLVHTGTLISIPVITTLCGMTIGGISSAWLISRSMNNRGRYDQSLLVVYVATMGGIIGTIAGGVSGFFFGLAIDAALGFKWCSH